MAASGEHAGAADLLGALVEAAPLDEALQLEHLTALHSSGQAATALLVYDAFRRRLRHELGTDPSPASARLHAQLLQPKSDGGSSSITGATGDIG